LDDGQQVIRVNNKEYAFPPSDLTLGEMCDAEQYFGVDFNAGSQSGMRMTAALLWIAIRRQDKTVTVDDVRDLDPQVFAELAGDNGNPPTSEPSVSSEPPSSASTTNSDGSALDPPASGSPGSATGSTSDPPTLATSPPAN
jgi:hypothetical protein